MFMVGFIQRQGLIFRCSSHMHKNGVCYTTMTEQMAPVECNLNTQVQSTPQNQTHYTR